MSIEVAIALGAAIAAGAAWQHVQSKRARRAFQATPRLTAQSLVGTTVIAIGKVRTLDGHELDAPLSGRPCVAFRARVYNGPAPDSAWWGTANATSFALEREDGTRVGVAGDAHVEFLFPPLPLPADARCDEFMLELGVSPKVRKRATYEEVIVLEDMRIAVRGRLVANGAEPRLAGDRVQPIMIGVPF